MQVLYCIVLWFSHLRLLVVQVHVQLQVQVQVQVQVQGDALPFAFQLQAYILFGLFIVHVQVKVYFWCM